MAAVAPEPTSSSKRSPNSTINLVPLIDLLSSLIAFLLMTAVWTQVGSLPAATDGPSAPSDSAPPPTVHVHLAPERILVTLEGSASVSIGGQVLLTTVLRGLKSEHPGLTNVVLHVEDEVPHALVVEAIDACVGAQLPEVTISAVS